MFTKPIRTITKAYIYFLNIAYPPCSVKTYRVPSSDIEVRVFLNWWTLCDVIVSEVAESCIALRITLFLHKCDSKSNSVVAFTFEWSKMVFQNARIIWIWYYKFQTNHLFLSLVIPVAKKNCSLDGNYEIHIQIKCDFEFWIEPGFYNVFVNVSFAIRFSIQLVIIGSK